jgi:hypothetical protein
MASVADILGRLGQLHADGFLTDEEFTEQKHAFLSTSNTDELTPENMEAADGELGELEKLAELCRSHVLTREEFELQKRTILEHGMSTVTRELGAHADLDVSPRTSPIPVGWEWVLIVAGILAVIGSFLPWEQVSAGIASFNRNGYQLGKDLSFSPDGLIVTGLAAIAALIGLTRLTRRQFPRWLNGSPTILGAVILYFGITDEHSLSDAVSGLAARYPMDLFSVGYGVWIVIVSGAIIAIAGIAGWWGARAEPSAAAQMTGGTSPAVPDLCPYWNGPHQWATGLFNPIGTAQCACGAKRRSRLTDPLVIDNTRPRHSKARPSGKST